MKLVTHKHRGLALAAMLLIGTAGAQSPAGFDAPMVVLGNYEATMVELLDFDGNGQVDAVKLKVQTSNLGISVGPVQTPWSGLFGENLPISSNPTPRTAVGTVGIPDASDDFAVGFGLWVRVYLGAPVGPYGVHAVFNEPAIVRGIAIRDFDGDGFGDVAVLTDNELRVHRHVSPGVFSLVTHALPLSTTSQLVAGDANADGVDDLLVVDASWTIFTMSAGALVPGATYVHGIGMPMPTMGDIDGDGDDDVVIFGMTDYVVFRHTTPGTFVAEPVTAGGPATHLYDIDGDGDLDGACCSGGGGGGNVLYTEDPSIFRVSINQGGGAFAPAFEFAGIGAIHLAGVADIDGDGIKDIAAGRCVYYPRAPLTQNPWPAGPASPIGARTIVDAEQDGDPDWSFGLAATTCNQGNGQSISTPTVLLNPPPPGTTYTAPGYPGDWDGDGDVDLLVEHMAGPNFLGMVLLKNEGGAFTYGGPAFPPSIQFSTWIGNDPERTIAADCDGDGDLDIVGKSPGPAYWSVVSMNAGNGTFTPTESFPLEVIIHVADFTYDGLPDYLVSDGRIRLRRGLPGGGHGPPEQLAQTGNTWFNSVTDFNPFIDRIAVADFNADGRLDLVGGNRVTLGDGPTWSIWSDRRRDPRFRSCHPGSCWDSTGCGESAAPPRSPATSTETASSTSC